ncbi:hypothetical protein [Rhodococcus qingshengii]|uniref:hypothetical protein n=1 Tax=Rhodococcus qingshengii TaxID=334542 RepID=UPI0035D6FAFF
MPTTYINMASGKPSKLIEHKGDHVALARITKDGKLSNIRWTKANRIRSGYLNTFGHAWKTGYVNSNQIPKEHIIVDTPDNFSPNIVPDKPDLRDMTFAQLMEYTLHKSIEAKELNDLVEEAKDEIRRRGPKGGDHVRGKTWMRAEYTTRFSPKLAQENLTEDQLAKISIAKVDPKRAREVFGEDSKIYISLCEPTKTKITIREATDEEMADLPQDADPVPGGDDHALWSDL